MKKFDPQEYYKVLQDNAVLDRKLMGASPLQSGRQMVADYYHNKYGSEIIFPVIEKNDALHFVGYGDFAANPKPHIEEARRRAKVGLSTQDYRCTFFIGAEASHAFPISYIYEDGKEYLLLADSHGNSPLSSLGFASQMKKAQLGDINIHIVEGGWQAASFSCYSNTLVFGRTLTARNKNGYVIPKLAAKLEERCEEITIANNTFKKTLLPDEFLVASQINAFTNEHREKEPRPIHGDETLQQFSSRYILRGVLLSTKSHKEGERKDLYDYIRIKGFKLVRLMEIQFYKEQLQQELGNNWNDGFAESFTAAAKKVLKSQDLFAVHERRGLHDFAEAVAKNPERLDEFLKRELRSGTPDGSPGAAAAAAASSSLVRGVKN